MSVINKMLKDLEQQQQAEIQHARKNIVTNNSPTTKILWLLILVILILLAWNFRETLFGENKNNEIVTKVEKVEQIAEVIKLDSTEKAVAENTSRKILGNDEITAENKPEKIVVKQPENKPMVAPEKDKPLNKKLSVSKEIHQQQITEPAEIITITKNPISPELRARNLWKQAEIHPANAEKLLQEALSLSSSLHGARLQLIALFVSQQRMTLAETTVDKGLLGFSENSNYIEWKARLRIAANDSQVALQWLLKTQPEMETHINYYGLQAGVASQLSHHEKAMETYTGLVEVQPQHGPWLLGLAISTEKLGQKQRALNIYKKAQSAEGLTPRAQLFIQQKLDKLES